jgi:hypothetical protein
VPRLRSGIAGLRIKKVQQHVAEPCMLEARVIGRQYNAVLNGGLATTARRYVK